MPNLYSVTIKKMLSYSLSPIYYLKIYVCNDDKVCMSITENSAKYTIVECKYTNW